jgi:hypothetical protein
MKSKGWFTGVVVVGCAVLGVRSGGCLNSSRAPDEKLSSRFEDLCVIAQDNVETPVRGVRRLGSYLGKHTEDILGELGATLQIIEKTPDDRKHDDRARLARDRMQRPFRASERDWQRFGEAVHRDREANALVERAVNRLNRTFEIIFKHGTVAAPFDLRELPAQLERAFEEPQAAQAPEASAEHEAP